MARFIITLLIAFATHFAATSQINFEGCRLAPQKVDADASTGLDGIYVLHDLDGATLKFSLPQGATAVQWSKFGYMGAAYAEPIDPTLINTAGGVSTLSLIEGDTGYAINYGADTYYIWVVDYSKYPFKIESLNAAAEQDCGSVTLDFDGEAKRITYYSINARALELDRKITLTYNTLVADNESATFVEEEREQSMSSIQGSIHVSDALCNTRYTLSGDRFLKAWGLEESFTTPTVYAEGIEVVTKAEQQSRENDNEIKVEAQLGGSAPVTIDFKGAVSDAAVYHEWQMSRDLDFYDIVYRNSNLEFSYTFTEMGTTYVRLLAANNSGSCEMASDPYAVYVGESVLRCPNAFSPGASEGVNDEWKVSYKSIVSFECYIFDRWGTKLFEFHDPSQGWDGKYKGKLVAAGAYYYVIKARGADGKDYNLSGDINILKSNR